MKKILLLLGLITLLIGCASTQEMPRVVPSLTGDYHETDLFIGDLPKMTVTVPEYAREYMKDYDSISTVYLSDHVVMIYFEKEGPDISDPGHAVSIIVYIPRYSNPFLYMTLFFQTTIVEEQRFFVYDTSGTPIETDKPTYRDYLRDIIEEDKSKKSL